MTFITGPLAWPLGRSKGRASLRESAFSLRESTKFYMVAFQRVGSGQGGIVSTFQRALPTHLFFCAIGKLRNSYVVFIVEEFFALS